MALVIHCRQTPEGLRYRLWSTSADAYASEALTRVEVEEFLIQEAIDQARFENVQRLERAEQHGTSGWTGRRTSLHAPWREERCAVCGSFHQGEVPCSHS